MTAAMAMNKLNENALFDIVGGTYNQVAGDSRFLNDVGAGCDRYGASKTFFAYGSISEETTQAWNKFGVSVANSWGGTNKYYVGGKEVGREDAMRIVASKQGKDISKMNFTDY